MYQVPMSISKFKRGDIITRVEPSKPIPGFEDMSEEMRDRAYIGQPFRFLGIANGCVNIERYQNKVKDDEMDFPTFMGFLGLLGGGNSHIALPMDLWCDGWSLYIDPYTLGDERFEIQEDAIINLSESREELERQLKNALSEENYESAKKIQKRINALSKK